MREKINERPKRYQVCPVANLRNELGNWICMTPSNAVPIIKRNFSYSCQSITCLSRVSIPFIDHLGPICCQYTMWDFAEVTKTTTVVTSTITLSLYTQMSMGGNCFSYSPELQGPSSGQFVYSIVPPLLRSTEEVE